MLPVSVVTRKLPMLEAYFASLDHHLRTCKTHAKLLMRRYIRPHVAGSLCKRLQAAWVAQVSDRLQPANR